MLLCSWSRRGLSLIFCSMTHSVGLALSSMCPESVRRAPLTAERTTTSYFPPLLSEISLVSHVQLARRSPSLLSLRMPGGNVKGRWGSRNEATCGRQFRLCCYVRRWTHIAVPIFNNTIICRRPLLYYISSRERWVFVSKPVLLEITAFIP